MTDQYVDNDYDGEYEEPNPDESYGDEYGAEYLDEMDELYEEKAPARRARPSVPAEGRTSWYYLGLLGVLFVLLVMFSWACNDRSPGTPIGTEPEAAVEGAESAVRLNVQINEDVVSVRGAVPDEAAREQILAVAQEQYGAESVIDELEIDPATTLEGGAVSITGAASGDDPRPDALREAIAANFGLEEAEFAVNRDEAALNTVDVAIEVSGANVRLVGGVPDQQSIEDLTAAAETVWGAGNVDNSGLTVTESTWTDGSVRVTGTASPGDNRAENLTPEIQSRFGALVTVDIEGLEVDSSPEALQAIEEQINTELAAQPIRFAAESADIDAESDAVLAEIALTLNSVPAIEIEVVGHTDNAGSEEENLALSQQRAEAVIARLTSLGVDGSRLNARGEGEEFPIADNGTSAGREQNRRIEFRLAPGQ